MNEKKLIYLLGGLLIVALLVIAFFIGKDYSNNNSSSNSNNETSEQSNTNTDDKAGTDANSSTKNDDNTSNSSSLNNSNNNKDTQSYSVKDITVIDEVENIETDTVAMLNSGNDETIMQKAKGVFVTLVDFIFYGGEIKGVTFEELTEAGKEKVLAIVNSIDEKIEEKFPGYKETISSGTKSAFTEASETIKEGIEHISEFSREKLGEENYNAIIDAKDELVKYSQDAWSIVKESGGSLFDSAKDKVKNWYENFREN